jgi:hypothetical protein
VDLGTNATADLAGLTPRFEFLLDDIGRASDEEIQARALDAFGILALLFLRDVRTPERFLSRFPYSADLFGSLLAAPDGPRALMVLFRYVSMVADTLGLQRFRQIVHKVLPEAEDSLMTIAEEMRQQGLQQGLEQGVRQGLEQGVRQGLEQGVRQGLEQGVQQGQRALLLDQLQTKFGSTEEPVRRLIDAADEQTLKRYAQRILTAVTLDDVFA